jgi:hypothetical protein
VSACAAVASAKAAALYSDPLRERLLEEEMPNIPRNADREK